MWVSYGNAYIAGHSEVHLDPNRHCRSVDDSKLLRKNLTSTMLQMPDSCHNLPAACTSDRTSPKVADVHRSITASLQTDTSVEPLLRPRPDTSHQSPWYHVISCLQCGRHWCHLASKSGLTTYHLIFMSLSPSLFAMCWLQSISGFGGELWSSSQNWVGVGAPAKLEFSAFLLLNLAFSLNNFCYICKKVLNTFGEIVT